MHVHDAQEMPFTDFIKWNKYVDDVEFHSPTLLHFMLAQVCQEIRRIWLALGGKGKLPDLDDFIVKFKQRDGSESTALKGDGAKAEETKKGIEIGEELDDKWKITAAMAKARWGAFLSNVPVGGPDGGSTA